MEACLWELDDIFIYGLYTEAEHLAIVKTVLQQYIEHALANNKVKLEFHVFETIFP